MYQKTKLRFPEVNVNYSIDTNGVVVNEDKQRIVGGRLKGGYHLMCVKGKWLPVHRMVAKAFIPNPEGKPYINHINGIKNDNRAENLEWCTHLENMQHAKRTGLWKPHLGESHGRCNTSEATVRDVCKDLENGLSWPAVRAKHYEGITRSTFYAIKYRKIWKAVSEGYNF